MGVFLHVMSRSVLDNGFDLKRYNQQISLSMGSF